MDMKFFTDKKLFLLTPDDTITGDVNELQAEGHYNPGYPLKI